MALHIYSGSGAPSFAPQGIGHHYVDTTNKVSYVSVGTSGPSDWESSDASSVIAAHVADSDPHPQYLTAAEGNAAYDSIGSASAAVATHEGLSDPHPQYLTPAEGSAAFDALGSADSKVSDAIADGVTTVAPSQNAVFDALASKAASSHTHALSDITQSGATTGQVIKWDGSSWVPDSDSNSGTWGSISGTLSDQTDLQSALDGKQNSIAGNNSRFIVKNASGDVESNDNFQLNSYGGFQVYLDDTFADAEPHSTNSEYYGLIPSEDAPDTSINVKSFEASIDPSSSGFDFGVGGQAMSLFNNYVKAEGTGDVGGLSIFSNSFTVGNGTDPISVRGVSYGYGFGEIKSGVTINGPMQGWGFQPVVRSGATVDPSNSYTQAFYDNMSYEGACSYHTSFNSGPSINTIPNGRNYTGFNANPTVQSVSNGGGITCINVGGDIGTLGENSYFHGININPSIDSARYAVGINVTMDNVTAYPGAIASKVIQDLTIAADLPGATDNTVTVEYTSGATAGAEVVSASGLAFQVQIESGVSTAQQIADALNAFPGFTTNLNVTVSGTGSNAQTTQGPVNLAGGVDPGTKKAAYFDGDVEITGSLAFQGSLNIEKLNAFGSQAIVDGGGTPTTIHGLITQPTVADNVTLTSGDTIAVNTAALISIGDNATVGTTFIGLAALGLPAVLTMGTGSTLDRCYASLFALSLDAASGGGTVDEVGLCRSVAIPNGVTTVNKLKGFLFDLPFGDPGTTTWGVYISPTVHNFMSGDLKIGGSDVVASPNVALEIESTTKALVLSRMDTTARNAMTPIAGMVIFNTTTSTLQYYDGTSWI